MGKEKKQKKEKKEKSKKEDKDRRKRSRKDRDQSPGPASAPHRRRSTSSLRQVSYRPVQAPSKDEGYFPSRQRRVEPRADPSPAVPAVPPVRVRGSAFTPEPSLPHREPLGERAVYVEHHQAARGLQSPPQHVRAAGDSARPRDGRHRGSPAKEQQPPRGRHQQDPEICRELVQQTAPKRSRHAGDFNFARSTLGSMLRPPGPGPDRRTEAARHAEPRHMRDLSSQLASRLGPPVQAPPQDAPPSPQPSRLRSSTPAATESRSASQPPRGANGALDRPLPGLRHGIAPDREGHVPHREPTEKAMALSANLEAPMSQFSEFEVLRRKIAERERALASRKVGNQDLKGQPSQQRPANRDSLPQRLGANTDIQHRKRSASPGAAVPDATRPTKAACATSTATPVSAQAGRAQPMPIRERPSAQGRSLMPADRLGVDEDARGPQPSLKTGGLPGTSRVPMPPAPRAVSTEQPRQAPAPARHPPAFGIKSLDEIRKEKAARSVSPARSGAALPASSAAERVRARARAGTPTSTAPGAPQPVAESGVKRKRPPIKSVPIAKDGSVSTAAPPGLFRAPSIGDVPDGKKKAPGGRVADPGPIPAPGVVPPASGPREQRPAGDKTSAVPNAQPQPEALEPASNVRLRARIPIPPPSKGPNTVPSVGSAGPRTVPATRAAIPVPNRLHQPAAPDGPIPKTPSPTSGVPALPTTSSVRNTETPIIKLVTERALKAGLPALETTLAAAGQAANGTEVKLGALKGDAKEPVDGNGASAGAETSGTLQAGGAGAGGLQPRFARKLPSVKKVEEPAVPYEHKSMTVMKGGDALEIRYYMHVPTGATERLRLRRLRQEAEDRARAEQAHQATTLTAPASNGIADEHRAQAVENGTASVPDGVAGGDTGPAAENGTASGLEGVTDGQRGTVTENGGASGPDGAANGGASNAAQDPGGLVRSGALEGQPEMRADGDRRGLEEEKAGADKNEGSTGRVVHHVTPVVPPT